MAIVPHATTRVTPDLTLPIDLPTVELRARLEALAYTRADLVEMYGGAAEYSRSILEEHERVLRRELARRERLYRAGADVPDPRDARWDVWLGLAREARERADIVQVLADAGHQVYDTGGYSRRRDAREYAGPCPWCGGRDRFRVWRGRDSGYWCRRCGVAGDVIALVRNLIPGCEGFLSAVAYLARELGLSLPDDPATMPTRHVVRLRAVEVRRVAS
ncbi:MAG: primase-helicase zinc-binding domain-containing protein [Sphaerobacter sp.]|nr:primase-helicase zinc-binding domain-containing protein [Sphaerobacter sp.]